MIQTGINLEMNPEILTKLNAGNALWTAAHDDGSKNRINGDVVLEAGSYATSFGILAALLMWIRKKFRNRGKTAEDFAAEKEAARINRTCGALEVMLMEYFQSAQKGQIDEAALDELIDTLEEMQGYDEAGKLILPGKAELTEIRKSIEKYTAAIAQCKGAQPKRETAAPGKSEFRLIREQLLLQKP